MKKLFSMKNFVSLGIPPAARCRRNGFTLIELSIVLVILGLIAGGVLVGKDIIATALIRKQVSELNEFTVAANTFKLKYGGLPGDISDTTRTQFGFASTASAGYGTWDPYCQRLDGRIRGCFPSQAVPYYNDAPLVVGEPQIFFVDLSSAGFIKGNYIPHGWGSPPMRVGSGYEVPPLVIKPRYGLLAFTDREQLGFLLLITTSDVAPALAWIDQHSPSPALTPAESYALDAKLDDGIPSTGRVRAVDTVWFQSFVNSPIPLDTHPGQCVVDATARAYNLTLTSDQCRMFVSLQ